MVYFTVLQAFHFGINIDYCGPLPHPPLDVLADPQRFADHNFRTSVLKSIRYSITVPFDCANVSLSLSLLHAWRFLSWPSQNNTLLTFNVNRCVWSPQTYSAIHLISGPRLLCAGYTKTALEYFQRFSPRCPLSPQGRF